MLTGRAISDEPCRCRRRASVVCRCWGTRVGLRPGTGFPLVTSRRAASCEIRSNSDCTSPTTTTKAGGGTSSSAWQGQEARAFQPCGAVLRMERRVIGAQRLRSAQIVPDQGEIAAQPCGGFDDLPEPRC
jgi:hypothetical protein